MSTQGRAHWNSIARQWKHFGPPLRPCTEDIQIMEGAVATHCHGMDTIEARLCGVTPEIASMTWPSGTMLKAIERSQEMIAEVWPGDIEGRREAICGEWLQEDLRHHRCQIVIGDGCFISMTFPDGYRALAGALHEALTPEGMLIMRFFTQALHREDPRQVLADLTEGRIGSFHVFKWRLAMSLQESSQAGVGLNDIYETWAEARLDTEALAARNGWSPEEIRTIDLYRGKQNRFAFATGENLRAVFAECFTEVSRHVPGYELGERCPIMAFRPR